jgi:hypothetical protein
LRVDDFFADDPIDFLRPDDVVFRAVVDADFFFDADDFFFDAGDFFLDPDDFAREVVAPPRVVALLEARELVTRSSPETRAATVAATSPS